MLIFRNKYFKLFLVFFLTIITFYPSLNGQFLNWDDTAYISLNKLLENNISWSSFLKLYNFDSNISLVLFSFLVQMKLFGSDPFSFHLFNLFFHIFNVILIYKISDFLFNNSGIAVVAALVFSIHPLKAESVAWIMQRKDIMFTFFGLIGMLFYIKHLKTNRLIYFVLVLLSGYFSSLCKVQAIALPFSLLLIDYYYSGSVKTKAVLLNGILLATLLTRIEDLPKLTLFVIIPVLIVYYSDFITLRLNKIINFFRSKIKGLLANRKTLSNKLKTVTHLGIVVALIISVLFLARGLIIDVLMYSVIKKQLSLIIKLFILLFTISFIFISVFTLIRSHNKDNSKSSGKFGVSAFNKIKNFNNTLRKIFYSKDVVVISLLILFTFLFLNKLYQIFVFYKWHNVISFDIVKNTLYFSITLSLLLLYKLKSIFITTGKNVKFILVFFVVACIGFGIFFIGNPYVFHSQDYPFMTRVIFACYSFNYYLFKFIFPYNLSAMHPYPETDGNFLSSFWIYPVITFILVGFTIYMITRIKDKNFKKEILFGIMFFIINISLVLHIIPIKGRVIVADRYTYLSYFGLIFLMFALLKHAYQKYKIVSKNIKVFKIIGFATVVLLSFQTYSRSQVWENDKAFWSDVLSKDSQNHYAYYSLGLYYYEQQNFSEAIAQYNNAIVLNPKSFEYYSNRGACFVKIKNFDAAIKDFEQAINLNSDDFASYYNRGVLLFNTGDLTGAKADIEKSLQIKPDYAEAVLKLEQIEILLSSVERYNTDLTQNRELSDYYNKIGMDYAMKNDMLNGLNYFNLAVKYDTINIGAIQNRGNVYAALKNFESAKTDFYNIIKIAPGEGGAYLNLANIMHESGNVKKACELWNTALSLGVTDAQFMIDKFCN